MDVRDYLRGVRAHWVLAVSLLLLGVAGAALLSWLTVPKYAATTQFFVSTSDSGDVSAAYQGNLFSQQRVNSYASLLRGEEISRRVIDDLDLDMTAAALSSHIVATVIPDTVILQATVTDTSAERAKQLADTLGTEFPRLVQELERPSGEAALLTLTVVEKAKLPTTPVEPNIPRNLGGGLVLGLLAGLGAAVLRDRLDNTVKTVDSAHEITGATALGTVTFDVDLAKRSTRADVSPQRHGSESYRQLRTNLQFVDVDNPPRVLVVTSSISGEGKTTTAVNLALVLAQSGQRVCLIEGDLRRPGVTSYLGLVSEVGLTNILAGSASIDDVIQPWGDGKLSVLAAGWRPPSPSEMLSSAVMRSVIQELREHNDFVIIDTPPLLPVTDAAVLAKVADGAVIIVKHGVTQRSQLALAVASLRKIDAHILGTVMNMVPRKASEAYGYGYGYGYGAYETKQPVTKIRKRHSRGATTAAAGTEASTRRGTI